MLFAIFCMILLWFVVFLMSLAMFIEKTKIDTTKEKDEDKDGFGALILRALVMSFFCASFISWLVFLTEVDGDTYAELSTQINEINPTAHSMRIKEYAQDGKITRMEYLALYVHGYWDNVVADYEEKNEADKAYKKLLIDKVKEENASKN